jgi:hypothetical protein
VGGCESTWECVHQPTPTPPRRPRAASTTTLPPPSHTHTHTHTHAQLYGRDLRFLSGPFTEASVAEQIFKAVDQGVEATHCMQVCTCVCVVSCTVVVHTE